MSTIKNLFALENSRTELAQKKKYQDFKKTYGRKITVNMNTGNFWDKKFESIDTFKAQDSMTKEKIDFIISVFPHRRCKVLDLGIGQAYLEQRLNMLEIRHDIYAIDISKKSIERSKNNFEGKFIHGDLLDIDKYYKKNYFDVVVAIEVIEHITPHNIFELYKKVHNILNTGGAFIVSTPLNEGLRYMDTNPSAHVREYTIPILETELKLSGFKIITMKTFYAFSNLYQLKKIFAWLIPGMWKPNNVAIKAVKL